MESIDKTELAYQLHEENRGKVKLEDVMATMADKPSMTTQEIYKQLSLDLNLDPVYVEAKARIGAGKTSHNLFTRRVRWHLMTLKRLGVVDRMDRGNWGIRSKEKEKLTEAPRGQVLLAFETDLGCGLWADCDDVFGKLQEQVTLCFTSPPFPLAKERLYGNVPEHVYVDWLIARLEPIVKNLVPGGNLVLNLSQDIFMRNSPARSTYLERLTLAITDKLSMHLMDRIIWGNPTKVPGPLIYASIERNQLNVSWEPVLWFSNCPEKVIADNRRVLQPHTDTHKALMARGGEKREASYSGGAYRLHKGSFGNQTEGAIPRNVLVVPHRDPDQKPARDYARLHGIPEHPAVMPTALSDFFVEFLSTPGALCVDPFGGWGGTARSCERKGRRWLITEKCRELIGAAAERFRGCPGFSAA